MRRLRQTCARAATVAFLTILACCFLLAGCGGGEDDATLTVLAAASLTEALDEYGEGFGAATVRDSFAGSDQLAAQIRQGAPADVFASADAEYPRHLHREGLVEKPRVFARNRLVVVGAEGGDLNSLAQLARPGMKIAIGSPSVPIGEYTRVVLGRLPTAERRLILANVRSEEPEVSSVIAKVANGAATAGFVYTTDARAAAGEVRTLRLPERLQPEVAYAAAVVTDSPHPALARRYLAGLLTGSGATALRHAGFLSP